MKAELISTSEAATTLRVSVPTINRWATEGRLRVAIQAPGRRGARFFRRSEIKRLAAKRLAELEREVEAAS